MAETPDDGTLHDVQYTVDAVHAVGADVVFRRSDDAWNRKSTPVGGNLRAVHRGTVDIAVGAGGTVIGYS